MAEAKFDQFKDNATTKIIAFDFDNTLTDSDIFPKIGSPRKYAREVVNLLYDLGVTVLIWTCRDKSKIRTQYCEEDNTMRVYHEHDDITPAVIWLSEHGFRYHDINTCIEYAPFHYEARKIYAHMYVDDKGFGWDQYDGDTVMLRVLGHFMFKHLGYDPNVVVQVASMICKGEEVNVEWVKSLK